MALNGGFWAAVSDPRYRQAEVAAPQPATGPEPVDRAVTPQPPGAVNQRQALFAGGQTNVEAKPEGYAEMLPPPWQHGLGGLDSYGDPGIEFEGMPRAVTPYDVLPGHTPSEYGPPGMIPRLSAFLNLDRIGPLMKRIPPDFSSVTPSVRDWTMIEKGQRPMVAPQYGYVTSWPQGQMLFRVMGPGGTSG